VDLVRGAWRRVGRTGLTPVALGLMVVACNGAGGPELSERERAAVAEEAEAVIHGFFTVQNERDTERVLAHYHQGPELIQVACTDVLQGYQRVEAVIRQWHGDQPDAELEYEVMRATAVDRDGAVVAARGLNARGEAVFWTFVLQREADGEWRLIQEHQSWAGCREPRLRLPME
jgi:ketosteroid isomerase-like protein